MICFIHIPGEPMGKGRPRYTHSGICYTPEKTRSYESQVKAAYEAQANGMFFEGPLAVTIVAGFQIPKALSKLKLARYLEGKERPQKKPDWDNVGKIVCDALNGIAYSDDKVIVESTVKKFWAAEPYVVMKISDEIPEESEKEYLEKIGYKT